MAASTEKRTETFFDCNSEEIENKIGVATQTLERNIAFITNCDNKTSIVLTVVGVLLTIILTNDGINKIFSIINSCIESKQICNIFYLICFATSIFIMVLGMFNLGCVLIAKTSEKANGLGGINSRIFFTGIVNNRDYKTYHRDFCLMKQEDLLDELIAQIYINADIAMQKYKKYNLGLRQTIVGFLLFIIILLVGIF